MALGGAVLAWVDSNELVALNGIPLRSANWRLPHLESFAFVKPESLGRSISELTRLLNRRTWRISGQIKKLKDILGRVDFKTVERYAKYSRRDFADPSEDPFA